MPMYIKNVYNNDPHFSDTKVVYSLYNNAFNKNWDANFEKKLKFEGFDDSIVSSIKSGDFISLNKTAMQYSDGIIVGTEDLDEELVKAYETSDCHKMEYQQDETQPKVVSEFFDKVIEEEVLIQ